MLQATVELASAFARTELRIVMMSASAGRNNIRSQW
jgi:hypothetical protein